MASITSLNAAIDSTASVLIQTICYWIIYLTSLIKQYKLIVCDWLTILQCFQMLQPGTYYQ